MATWTNITKNIVSWRNKLALGKLAYLLTDEPAYIMVGENEDQVLILWNGTSWTNQTKN